jgi:hypothetical protein
MRACGREVWGLLARERAPNTCECCTYGGWGLLLGWVYPAQACGNVPSKAAVKEYATSFHYLVYQLALSCGVPASTVALTLPAPDTCDGAYTRFVILST